MIALRLLLNLTIVVALAVVCPIRCQAEAVRTITGGAVMEADGCPCCPDEGNGTPDDPAPHECMDCVCHGAMDGPRVTAVEFSAAAPGDLPIVATVSFGCLAACALESLDVRPHAPDGAGLRLLIASLLI